MAHKPHKLLSVQSQAIVNASQNACSSPATASRSASFHEPAIRGQEDDNLLHAQARGIVEDSLSPVEASVTYVVDNASDELYSVSPKTQARMQVLQSLAKEESQQVLVPKSYPIAADEEIAEKTSQVASTASTEVVYETLVEKKSDLPLATSHTTPSQLRVVVPTALLEPQLSSVESITPGAVLAGYCSSVGHSGRRNSSTYSQANVTELPHSMAPSTNAMDKLRAKRELEGRATAKSLRLTEHALGKRPFKIQPTECKSQKIKRSAEAGQPVVGKKTKSLQTEAEPRKAVDTDTRPAPTDAESRPSKLPSIRTRLRGDTPGSPKPQAIAMNIQDKVTPKAKQDVSNDEPVWSQGKALTGNAARRQYRKTATKTVTGRTKEDWHDAKPAQINGHGESAAQSKKWSASFNPLKQRRCDDEENQVKQPEHKPVVLKSVERSNLTVPQYSDDEECGDNYDVPRSGGIMLQNTQAKENQLSKANSKKAQTDDLDAPTITRSKAAARKKESKHNKMTVHEFQSSQQARLTRGSKARQRGPVRPGIQEKSKKESKGPNKEGVTQGTKDLSKARLFKRDDQSGEVEGDLQNAEEIDESIRDKSKPGTTQDNPVELSDIDKSSSLGDTSPPVTFTNENAKHAASNAPQNPRTPTKMASSPPRFVQAPRAKAAQDGIDFRKPRITAFGKRGPLNQGFMPMNTPAPQSTKTYRSITSIPEQPYKVNGLFSAVTSTRTPRRSIRARETSNVAGDFGDALTKMRLINSTSSEPLQPDPLLLNSTHTKAGSRNKQYFGTAGDGGARFKNYDDESLVWGVTNLCPADAESNPASPPMPKKAFTTLQHMMRPPNALRVLQKQAGKTNTTSEQVMTPLDTPKTRKERIKRASPPQQSYEDMSNTDGTRETKRPRAKKVAIPEPSTASTERIKRKPKAAGMNQDEPKKEVAIPTTHATNRPKRANKEQPYEPPAAKKAKVDATDGKPIVLRQAPKEVPIRSPHNPRDQARNRLKRSQHASQCSQKVDVNGSPVPKDVNVSGMKSVLEVYSQNCQDASEQGTETRVRQALEKSPRHDDGDTFEDGRYGVSAHQTEILLGNKKTLPSSQQGGSPGEKTLMVAEQPWDKLLQGDDNFLYMPDPCDLLKRSSPSQTQSEASIASMPAKLSHLQIQMQRVSARMGLTGRHPAETLTNAQSVSKKRSSPDILAAATPKVAKFMSKPSKDIERNVRNLREQTKVFRTQAKPVPEDPDKTLVNEEASSAPEEHTENVSEIAGPECEQDQNGFEPLTDDLLEWSKDLKPHQLDLWHELMKVARAVVGHIVEQEQSFTRILEENAKGKEREIGEDEYRRTERYDDLMKQLRVAARNSKKEMKRFVRSVDDMHAKYRSDLNERAKNTAERAAYNRNLEDLLATFA